jgi:photosystem II stability/assembly factor-like uncharacterized protein
MRTSSIFAIVVLAVVMQTLGVAQKQFLGAYRVGLSTSSTIPPSNSVSHVLYRDGTLWIGSSKGLGSSTDLGRSWTSYRSDAAFATDGIFAISALDQSIWVATGFDKDLGDGSVQTGSGYAVSSDGGTTWSHLPQTLDQRGDSLLAYGVNDSIWILPVVVPEQNVTFDIAQAAGKTWIASWASGLRSTTDNGTTWQRVLLPTDDRSSLRPTDTLWTYASNDTAHLRRIFRRIDPRRNNNLLAFSVFASGPNTVWCGTAGGVNKSTDGGLSWTRFTHTNQASPILGNWVIAIDMQSFGGTARVWTTNWKAEDQNEEFGVSYSDDDGRIWTNLLHGIRAYDFAFRDSIAYIATDEGLYRTSDGGQSFEAVSTITDPQSHQRLSTSKVFSVDVVGDTVFIGTSDGMASTVDDGTQPFGTTWKIYRAYEASASTGTTYAYPNPFSPIQEPVRIHYFTPPGATDRSVTIELFDFGMNRVRSLVLGATRQGATEYDELWDGRNDGGTIVSNGVYMYRLQIDGGEPMFGKILVLQ